MNIIYKILWGSDAYGTTTNDSDNDIRGIWLPTLDESLSLVDLKDIRVMDETQDLVVYPLQKFVSLAINSNPSVFEWLFVPQKCIYTMEESAKMLRDNRLLFLSKQIYNKFRGFAYSEFSSLTKLTEKTGTKRKNQIMKYGYSPKNAMNCIRLLEQGIELLETSFISMPRPNAKELQGIKTGAFKYEKIVRTFDKLLKRLDEAKANTKLPEEPRFDDANNLMIQILKDFNIERAI